MAGGAVIFLASFCSLRTPAGRLDLPKLFKKNLLLITVTLALGLSWVGCNKSGKLDTASKFTAPAGPVELKLKWPVGERVVQNIDMKINMEISVPNQPTPIKQDMTMGLKY